MQYQTSKMKCVSQINGISSGLIIHYHSFYLFFEGDGLNGILYPLQLNYSDCLWYFFNLMLSYFQCLLWFWHEKLNIVVSGTSWIIEILRNWTIIMINFTINTVWRFVIMVQFFTKPRPHHHNLLMLLYRSCIV